MAYCTISGNVVDFDGGTLQPGAILKVFKVLSQAGSVISSTPRQYTFLAGGSWSPALRFERDSYAYIYLNAPGFDTNKETGIPLAIPNTATATLASLSADVNLPTEVPVVLQDLALNVVIADNVETADTYATLPDAITAIGSNVRTLVISSQQNLTDDLTVPKNVTTSFTGEGSISIASGKTLTINGSLIAPLRQIFTGAGSVRFGGNIPVAYPQWWGAVMDGSTDDSAAAQKAIDAFAPSGNSPLAGEVFVSGYMAIASTLTISDENVTLRGSGWGGSQSSEGARVRSVIRWTGSAGSPMILIHALGAGVRSLTLKGKSSAKPSAAIEISETSVFCDATLIEDVWIGSTYGFDDDNAVQFDVGILFSGTVDSDTNSIKRVFIHKCTIGINITNPNAAISHFDVLQTISCTTGLKTVAPQILLTNWACALNDADLELAAQGVDVTLRNYVSEGSGRMATASVVGPLRLVVDGGSFQADGSSGAKFETGDADYSGKRAFLQFKTTSATGLWLEVRNFNLQQVNAPAIPIIQAWNTSDNTTPTGATQVQLILEGVRGFTSANIDLGSDGYTNSFRSVVFRPQQSNVPVAPQMTQFIQNSAYGSEDGTYQDLRHDFTGKVNIYGGSLRVKSLPLPATLVATATGSGATTYSYKATALDRDGNETAPTSAATCTNAALGGGVFNTITFHPLAGAASYKIYGRSSGSELLMKTLTVAEVGDTAQVTWVDNGSVTPSGALPTINKTGNAKVDGIFAGGKGADVASASTIAATGNVFHVTGTTTITSVSGTGIAAGTEITIIFDGALTFTDGSNLKLNGNFSTSADDTIKLVYDGSSWYEVSRSTN